MSSVPVETVKVAQALNEVSTVQKTQTKYEELQYITKWALMNNITRVHLDSSDLLFLNGALGI